MSWAKENKFLTGYIAVMVIGIGALGFKVFSASSALDDANARYSAKASSYDSLRRVEPFPSRENLAVYEAQKKEAAEVITAFQADLAKREFPFAPLSPEQFQDQLKKAVTEVRAKGNSAGTKFDKGDKFFLGFDRYETAPPDKDVAVALGRELKAIEWVVDQFLSAPVAELKVDRPEMPEEKGKAANKAANPPQKGPGAGPGKSKPDLVTSRSFDITVLCKQRQFANVLNAIISAKAPQFYIPRTVKVTNQNQKGPPKVDPQVALVDPTAPPAGAPGVPGAPATPPPKDLHYIVGEELLTVTLRLEIVDFAEPSSSTASK